VHSIRHILKYIGWEETEVPRRNFLVGYMQITGVAMEESGIQTPGKPPVASPIGDPPMQNCKSPAVNNFGGSGQARLILGTVCGQVNHLLT